MSECPGSSHLSWDQCHSHVIPVSRIGKATDVFCIPELFYKAGSFCLTSNISTAAPIRCSHTSCHVLLYLYLHLPAPILCMGISRAASFSLTMLTREQRLQHLSRLRLNGIYFKYVDQTVTKSQFLQDETNIFRQSRYSFDHDMTWTEKRSCDTIEGSMVPTPLRITEDAAKYFDEELLPLLQIGDRIPQHKHGKDRTVSISLAQLRFC